MPYSFGFRNGRAQKWWQLVKRVPNSNNPEFEKTSRKFDSVLCPSVWIAWTRNYFDFLHGKHLNLESSDPPWLRSRIFAQFIRPCCMQLMLHLNSCLKTCAHKLQLLDLWWQNLFFPFFDYSNCCKFCSPFLCHVLRSNQDSGNRFWRWLLAHDCHCLQLHWKFYHHVACKL